MTDKSNPRMKRLSVVRKVISNAEYVTWMGLGWVIILGFSIFVALAIVGLIYSLF